MTKLVKTSYQNIAKTKKRNPTNFGCKITETLPAMGLVTISKLDIFRKPKNKLAEDLILISSWTHATFFWTYLTCLFFFQASNCSSLGGETVGKKCSTLQRGRKPDCSKFVQTRVSVERVHQVSDALDLDL